MIYFLQDFIPHWQNTGGCYFNYRLLWNWIWTIYVGFVRCLGRFIFSFMFILCLVFWVNQKLALGDWVTFKVLGGLLTNNFEVSKIIKWFYPWHWNKKGISISSEVLISRLTLSSSMSCLEQPSMCVDHCLGSVESSLQCSHFQITVLNNFTVHF